MKSLPVALLTLALAATAQAADQVAQDSGEWNSITWTPGPLPAAADVVHIEGGFTVNYTGGSADNLSRIYVGDNTGGLPSIDGNLEVTDGTLTVNANAAGAFLIGRADGSTAKLTISGGALKGVGITAGAGMQVGFGVNSTGTVIVDGGELHLASGLILGYGDNSTAHFEISKGTVTVSNSPEGADFNVGSRTPGSSTATYVQTGGSVTIVHKSFRVGYAGSANQRMNASARITGGSFIGNVLIGRQSSLKTGAGSSGTLTIGAAADVSGNDLPWEISGTGELIFALGKNDAFKGVDLTNVTAETGLIISQDGAKLTVDGSALAVPTMKYKPITLMKFVAGKGPTEESKARLTASCTGFDPKFAPELIWTDSTLELKISR